MDIAVVERLDMLNKVLDDGPTTTLGEDKVLVGVKLEKDLIEEIVSRPSVDK